MYKRLIILTLVIISTAFTAISQNTDLSEYDNSWEIKPGICKVRLGRNYGIVSKDGTIIVPCEFIQIWDIDNNGLLKVLKGRRIGLYNLNGVEVAPPEYDQIYSFDNGRARVLKNGKTGYIDTMGREIIPADYDQIWSFDNGWARIMKNGKIGYVDKSGKEIIPPIYNQIWDFENGRARVLKNGKIGYIDDKGNEIIPPLYTQIWDFKDGRARVYKNGKFGYIDSSGNVIIPPVYDNIWDFKNNRAKVYKNGKFGYIDESGNEIIPPVYNNIWKFKNGKAKVYENGKFGYIDENGNVLIAPRFDRIGDFKEGKASAVYDGKWVVIDDTGNILNEKASPEKVIADEEIEIPDTAVSVAAINVAGVNDSIFNDSTVVRIWSDRVEIISKKDDETGSNFTYIKTKNKIAKKRKKFKGHWAGMNVSYNNLMTAGNSFEYPDEYMYMEMNAGKSVGVAVNPWQQSIKLQRRGNIGLVTGLGVEWNNYRFDSQYVLTKDETTGNTTYYTEPKPIKRNKLTTIYLNAPLLLEFQIPTGKERYPFYILGGAIGGLRLGSHTKVVYTDGAKQKGKDNFNLTQWRYGVTVRIGYRAINLFVDYYLSPIFKKDKGPDLYQVSAGIFIYPDY